MTTIFPHYKVDVHPRSGVAWGGAAIFFLFFPTQSNYYLTFVSGVRFSNLHSKTFIKKSFNISLNICHNAACCIYKSKLIFLLHHYLLSRWEMVLHAGPCSVMFSSASWRQPGHGHVKARVVWTHHLCLWGCSLFEVATLVSYSWKQIYMAND